MSTYTWSVPTGNTITGTTYIKDTDNKIQATIDDLVEFVNGEGSHSGQGLTYDFVDKLNAQTITGVKTFQSGIIGNVTGNVTGAVTGNATSATTLATARNITLTGDATGTVSFNGSADANIAVTVVDDSHIHSTSTITGLDTALDTKQDVLVSGTNIKTINGVNLVGSGNADLPHATSSVYGTIKAYVSGDTLYITL